jgi:hypothetical protein
MLYWVLCDALENEVKQSQRSHELIDAKCIERFLIKYLNYE